MSNWNNKVIILIKYIYNKNDMRIMSVQVQNWGAGSKSRNVYSWSSI